MLLEDNWLIPDIFALLKLIVNGMSLEQKEIESKYYFPTREKTGHFRYMRIQHMYLSCSEEYNHKGAIIKWH